MSVLDVPDICIYFSRNKKIPHWFLISEQHDVISLLVISLAWSDLVKGERLWEKKHHVSWILDGRTLHFLNFHENKVTSEFFVHTLKSCNNTCSRVGLLEWKDYNYR